MKLQKMMQVKVRTMSKIRISSLRMLHLWFKRCLALKMTRLDYLNKEQLISSLSLCKELSQTKNSTLLKYVRLSKTTLFKIKLT